MRTPLRSTQAARGSTCIQFGQRPVHKDHDRKKMKGCRCAGCCAERDGEVPYAYVDQLSDSDIETIKGRNIVGCDPGKFSLVYMSDDTSKLRYNARQRRTETKLKKNSKILLTEKEKHGVHEVEATLSAEAYLSAHGLPEVLQHAVRKVIRERPADPVSAIGQYLQEMQSAKPEQPAALPAAPPVDSDSEKAAATIAGYLKCMNAKLKTSGKGEQNAELLLAHKAAGAPLVIEDLGGWARRNRAQGS